MVIAICGAGEDGIACGEYGILSEIKAFALREGQDMQMLFYDGINALIASLESGMRYDWVLIDESQRQNYEEIARVIGACTKKIWLGNIRDFDGNIFAKYETSIYFKMAGVAYSVSCEDILYISCEKRYIIIHTKKRNYCFLGAERDIEMCTCSDLFVKINRQEFVNISKVKCTDGDYVCLCNGTELAVMKKYSQRLVDAVNAYYM